MTEPPAQPALRSSLAELERNAPMPPDLPDRVLAAAADARREAPGRLWHRAAPLAAAVVVLLAVATAIVISSSRGGSQQGAARGDRGAPMAPAPWQTYVNHSMRFSVRYPIFWRAFPASAAGEFYTGIVYFSTQHVPSDCQTSDDGQRTSCGTPVIALTNGALIVAWGAGGMPRAVGDPPPIASAPGRPTTIDRRSAKVAMGSVTPSSACGRSGGDREVRVAIAAPHLSIVEMSACLKGSATQLNALTQIVLRSARSVRLND